MLDPQASEDMIGVDCFSDDTWENRMEMDGTFTRMGSSNFSRSLASCNSAKHGFLSVSIDHLMGKCGYYVGNNSPTPSVI